MSLITNLANYRGENPQDYTLRKINDYTFVDTSGHGFLVLGSDDNGYSLALEIARQSNFSPILDTLVYLEEDKDAVEFLHRVEFDNDK
jgi:hypothetical protein